MFLYLSNGNGKEMNDVNVMKLADLFQMHNEKHFIS